MLAIVDYGMANLRSVQKAFEAVGRAAVITADPAVVAAADHVVLPGVGAFRDAIARIRDAGFADGIRRHIAADKPFLGICLGLQLLFDRSHEDGRHDGLGVFPGDVVRFPARPGIKVPHMGWNTLRDLHGPLFAGLEEGEFAYFVHSFFAENSPEAVAVTDYGLPFSAGLQRDNFYAVQFHPEKSGLAGQRILQNFLAI